MCVHRVNMQYHANNQFNRCLGHYDHSGCSKSHRAHCVRAGRKEYVMDTCGVQFRVIETIFNHYKCLKKPQ